MYKDEIKAFLESKAAKQVYIPDHELISKLETVLDRKEFERAALLLNYCFRQHRHSIKQDREICGRDFAPYQMPIFRSVQVDLLGHTYIERVMSALESFGIITVVKKHFFKPEAGLALPTVYGLNQEVYKAKEKQITLTTANAINCYTQWLIQRQKPFSRVDRDVINKQHKYLKFDITSLEYAKQTRRQALLDAIAEAKEKGKEFDRKAWRKGYIHQCRQIDSWNQIPDREKWILCRVDPFGNRLHHGLSNAPSSLREYARIGELVPLFEIDLVSSQPTITAINMAKAGVIDEAFFKDINDGRLYERYAERRGLGWSRGKAKSMIFTAFFGSADSSEMKNLEASYPVLASYLRKVKSEVRPQESKTLNDYKPSKNNCIDVQRAESSWARQVWKQLHKAGVRFLPIHDSVVVFGYEYTTFDKIGSLQMIVEKTMSEGLVTEEIKPRFKTTEYTI